MTVHAYLNLYTREQLADRCVRLDGELAAEHALAEALKHSLGLANAENAKLRQQLADVTESMGRVEERCAKLRELTSGLHRCWVDEGCEGCPMQDDDGWCVRDIRLRELGVEVDE